jgi:hypothetical protein
MNYLTNYYKNLSEDLSRRVTLLENYLTEMQAQIASGNPEIAVSETDIEAAVAPPTSKTPSHVPPRPTGPSTPTNPGPAPKRRDGESDKQYQDRYKQWLKETKRWEIYQKFREEIERGGNNVFTWPTRIPNERVGDEMRAIPPAKTGDIYITENGQVYRVVGNNPGIWVLV